MHKIYPLLNMTCTYMTIKFFVNFYIKCFRTGCVAKTSTVTERSLPNISSHVSNTDSHVYEAHKKHSKKNKQFDTKKTLLSDIVKEPVFNVIDYDYQSSKNPDIEERPSKKLKTKEDSPFKDQDLYEDIVLFERPSDNAQTILEVSAAVSGVVLTWNYSKIEEGW